MSRPEKDTPLEIEQQSDLERQLSDDGANGDNGMKILAEDRVVLTADDDKYLRRKTDKHILTILIWVYFLQILDKTVLGYGNVFGLSKDTGLVGSQYSLMASMNAIAQIAWQPVSSYLIVKVPARYLMPTLVFCWGAAQACMAACHNFGGLVATRFLLGLFEAGCLPLFSILTAQWYRRSEQPIRVAAWYSTNGLATMFAAILSYGLGHINSPNVHSWQLIFIVVGAITVLTAPVVYWFVDSDIVHARFFTPEEKKMAVERLRANQTGTGTNEFHMAQVWEMLYDPKSWLFLCMALLLNVGASVTNVFGPTLIANFGFDKFVTALLNIPFGFLQFIWILVGSYLVQKTKYKGYILMLFTVPVIAGLAMIYAQAAGSSFNSNIALGGYYLLSFLFGGNPLIVSWIVANTAGQTKKSAIMSLYNAGSAAGNIIGPLLFNAKDKDIHYRPGVLACLGLFCALLVVIALNMACLTWLNRVREKQRVAHGKPAKIVDTSMSDKYVAYGGGDSRVGQDSLKDLTDFKNDEFTYVL